jgi:hypothetical protein
LALVNNALDICLGSPYESAIRVRGGVITKMIGYFPNSLKLVAWTSELLEEKVRIDHNTSQVINIDTNKFIVCANLSSRH